MTTTNTTAALDLDGFSLESLAALLRGMVSMRNDESFMRRERIDIASMTEQADEIYATMMLSGSTPAEIATMVPGVEVFA